LIDGVRESAQSWRELLLAVSTVLAIIVLGGVWLVFFRT
jgi:hypothetical protein